MIESQNTDGVGELGDLDAAGVLASIRASREVEQAEAARQLDLAAKWADLHPADLIEDAAVFYVPDAEDEEPIAGEGCPLVADSCVAELGITTNSATQLIGHVPRPGVLSTNPFPDPYLARVMSALTSRV